MIRLSSNLLETACKRFSYSLPETGLVLFGIRGALPADTNSLNFGASHNVGFADIDYQNMRCTLGQWDRASSQVSLFPGSTVPSARMIAKARDRGGKGTNRLIPGRFRYETGIHKRGKPGAHRAFRQASFFPVRRTANDSQYDNFDEIDFGSGSGDFIWDNLHSAYSESLTRYSSAGCQVVRGSPEKNGASETGPWKVFIDNAYGRQQRVFVYLLFEARQLALVAQADATNIRQVVCFGSEGDNVRALQEKLIELGHLGEGQADGDFGRLSLMALTAFQEQKLGKAETDGICGGRTAAALGIQFPLLSEAGQPEAVVVEAEQSTVNREDLTDETDLSPGENDRLRRLVSILFGGSERSTSETSEPVSGDSAISGILSRSTFYSHIRHGQFKGSLKQSQVDGIEALLDVWERDYPDEDPRWLAYILATIFHETGQRMVPVREGFASTDDRARRAVAKLFRDGRISRDYAKPVNGISYFGRGRVQVTHLANYQKLSDRFDRDFVNNPNLLLDPLIDAEVSITGHIEGLWTGKKLANYIAGEKCDYVNARRIVNGLDKAKMIAGYAANFETAVTSAIAKGPDAQTVERSQPISQPRGDTMNIESEGVRGLLGRVFSRHNREEAETNFDDINIDPETIEAIRELLVKQGILTPELTSVNGALGPFIGKLLDGKKTGLGIFGSIATAIIGQSDPTSILGQIVGGVLSGVPALAGMSGPMMPIFLGLTAWGFLGKLDKWRRQ